MHRSTLIAALVLLAGSAMAQPRHRHEPPPDTNRPKVRLHPFPPITTPVEPPLIDQKHILRLIAQLADISAPDYGYAPTLMGSYFAPIPGSEQDGVMLFVPHGLRQSPAVLALVKLGPRALPLLLQHLDDPTPTKFTVVNQSEFGQISFQHEMPFSEVNPLERMLITSPPPGPSPPEQSMDRHHDFGGPYRLRVGDVCFSTIGQIVGRQYMAVRYQPSGIVVINSPVSDAKLAQQVRAVWASREPVRHLFSFLLTDYSCRGIYNGDSLDGWDEGSELQCEAAMRLLYYFPQETAVMIGTRLHGLRVERTGPPDAFMHTDKEMALWMKREVANGVRTADFVRAVSWCRDPRIRTEIAAILKRSQDTDVRAAAKRRSVMLDRRKKENTRCTANLQRRNPGVTLRQDSTTGPIISWRSDAAAAHQIGCLKWWPIQTGAGLCLMDIA